MIAKNRGDRDDLENTSAKRSLTNKASPGCKVLWRVHTKVHTSARHIYLLNRVVLHAPRPPTPVILQLGITFMISVLSSRALPGTYFCPQVYFENETVYEWDKSRVSQPQLC